MKEEDSELSENTSTTGSLVLPEIAGRQLAGCSKSWGSCEDDKEMCQI